MDVYTFYVQIQPRELNDKPNYRVENIYRKHPRGAPPWHRRKAFRVNATGTSRQSVARERAATGTKIYKQVSSRPPQEDGNLIGNGFAKKLCIRHRAGIGSGIGTSAPTLENWFWQPLFASRSVSVFSTIFNGFPASGAHPISQ